jgi:hypothetical protein
MSLGNEQAIHTFLSYSSFSGAELAGMLWGVLCASGRAFMPFQTKTKGAPFPCLRPLPALLRLLALAVALEGPLLQKVRYNKQTPGDKHG